MARGAQRRPLRWVNGQESAQCLACGAWKPCASGFHHTGKDPTWPRSRCKDCLKLQRAERNDDEVQHKREVRQREQANPLAVQVVNGKRLHKPKQ